MLVSTKYHWNISFQKKLPSKYVVKNARSVTNFVWQLFFQWISRVCQIKNIKYIVSLILWNYSTIALFVRKSLLLNESFSKCQQSYNRNIPVGYFEGIYTCENLTFHLQTEKDVKFASEMVSVFTQCITSLEIAINYYFQCCNLDIHYVKYKNSKAFCYWYLVLFISHTTKLAKDECVITFLDNFIFSWCHPEGPLWY
jgi:hypothetical protein